MKIPRLGVESELQLPAYATDMATLDPSCICNLCSSLQQCWILNPLSEARDQTRGVLNLMSHNGNSLEEFSILWNLSRPWQVLCVKCYSGHWDSVMEEPSRSWQGAGTLQRVTVQWDKWLLKFWVGWEQKGKASNRFSKGIKGQGSPETWRTGGS